MTITKNKKLEDDKSDKETMKNDSSENVNSGKGNTFKRLILRRQIVKG